MQPYQQRVVDEKAELLQKIEALETFLGGEAFEGLPHAEQRRMRLQLGAMAIYYEELFKRIANFDID